VNTAAREDTRKLIGQRTGAGEGDDQRFGRGPGRRQQCRRQNIEQLAGLGRVRPADAPDRS